MKGNEYQELAMRTNDGLATERLSLCINKNMSVDIAEVINACLGLSGEVGELNDMVKKFIFHEHPIGDVVFKKELGDILWYIALMCHACGYGYELERIMEMNIEKLRARYPEGFSAEASINRTE